MAASRTAEPTQIPGARFWDRIAESYARKPVADEAAYQRKLRMTRDYLKPDMTIFEFGCGTGSTALAQAPFVKHILATDISPRMLDIARHKAEASGITNVEFQHLAIDEFDTPNEAFDGVLAMSILHLVEDKDSVIAQVQKMLKPGGVFVSSTACLSDGMTYFKPIAWIGRKLGRLPLVRFFTANDLVASLERHGFSIEQRWQPGKRKGVFIIAKKKL